MATIIIMGTGIPMTDSISASALYRLMTFLSPAFPIGAFTYSHGLEQVIERGDVTNAADLEAWLTDILRYGTGRNDAILLQEAHRACVEGDRETLLDLRELGLALQPSRERHLETSAQGTAFLETAAKSWAPGTVTPAETLFHGVANADRDPWPYPVALGLVCAAHAIPAEAATTSFLQAFAANIVSAAIRAVPLGQNDGQKVLAHLEPVIFEVSQTAASSGLEDLGSSTFLADIASMAHETQYSRLFRS
ncbi:urease accessory protein UreF [Roseibium sp. MMSF_3544]|uniref:urease accessory protein UreF n=1 Tax=unclassified Roseibium TaxID=2629323 RepID=UPI00273FC5FB|nr:urease accessory protein UreF [Roseibium sp. MMSF_3544]